MLLFFVKQKTAYEMRISDWSSDVCSSDLADVDAAHEQWAAANALLPGIEARQRGAVLGLGVLLGAPPERELKLLDTAAPALALPELPVGERADILRRRPDVLAAERQLAASHADTGLAPAALFPKLSIGAGGGPHARKNVGSGRGGSLRE